jgi:hypothetical protein
MRRRQPQPIGTGTFETVVEREDDELPLRGTCYVGYEVSVKVGFEPPSGNGWDEPRIEAHASFEGAWVLSVHVCAADGTTWDYKPGFIGPMEPGLVQAGQWLDGDLTSSEQETLEDEAIQIALDQGADYDPGDVQ